MVAKIDSSSGSTSDREIVITREINAPRELVWEAMTDPAQVVKWWGPRGFSTTIETMDVKPGGTWKHVMHGPDGTDYPNQSIFVEVMKPERIVYTHGGAKKGSPAVQFMSTWTFDAVAGNRTRVTIRHVFSTAEDRDRTVKEYGAIEGAKQTLERLGEFLEPKSSPLVVERTFAAPVALVWKALTDREAIKEWSFDLESFKPEVGCEFSFKAGAENVLYNHLCKVTTVIPEKKIAYTWRYEGYEGDSLVTFELFAENDKTRVKLTHEGLETFPQIPAFERKNFEMGWTSILGEQLPKYLEKDAS